MTVSNRGRSDALQVSWRPAAGVVDSYLVRLEDGKRVVHVLAVSSSSPPECSFSSLVAGRLYSVVIVTRSGDLENATVVKARTRKYQQDVQTHFKNVDLTAYRIFDRPAEPATVQNPTAVHSAREDYLKVCGASACGVDVSATKTENNLFFFFFKSFRYNYYPNVNDV